MCAGKLGLMVLFVSVPITIAVLPHGVDIMLMPETYVEMFQRTRVEQQIMVQRLFSTDAEQNYKMISMAIERIFKRTKRNRQILVDCKYSTVQGFPLSNPKQAAVREIIELTCMLADVYLYFPDITSELLESIPNWKHTVNWSIDFVLSFPDIIDALGDALMQAFKAEINYDERNPYNVPPNYRRGEPFPTPAPKAKKPRKKLKKGPQMMRFDL